ncbi:hypothetical protein GCM10009804_25570 [Kribbella hippodromi]|uniref:DUF2127 domain-containing protein n=1 Tax=Kribbella hippodromi TaxID=434347 RepID=A0ABP4NY24_9ACTN
MSGSVRKAVVAMYVGAGLTVAGAVAPIVDGATGDRLRHGLLAAYAGRPDQVDVAKSSILTYLFTISVIGVIAWLVLAWAGKRGKRWAPGAATATFLAGSAVLLYDFTQPHPLFITTIQAAPCLAGLAAVFYLWKNNSPNHINRQAPTHPA